MYPEGFWLKSHRLGVTQLRDAAGRTPYTQDNVIVACIGFLPWISAKEAFEAGDRLEVRVGKDRWRFESHIRSQREYFEDVVSITRNGRFVKSPRLPNRRWFPNYAYYKFARPQIATPYPVVAVRGHTGAGNGQGTRFYRIHRGKLLLMGQAPNKHSNGPVLWGGKLDHWLFDNEDVYAMREPNWTREYKLYRITPNGKLTFVRRWKAPQNQPLRDTIGLYF